MSVGMRITMVVVAMALTIMRAFSTVAAAGGLGIAPTRPTS
jgi:hypothetical protein